MPRPRKTGRYDTPAKRHQRLRDVRGLIWERDARRLFGIKSLNLMRRAGLIKPVGYAKCRSRLSAFYRPKDLERLRRLEPQPRTIGPLSTPAKARARLENTRGLVNERQAARRPGLAHLGELRRLGLIKPAGYALLGSQLSAYYRPKDLERFRCRGPLPRKIGPVNTAAKVRARLENTRGLISETDACRLPGLGRLRLHRSAGRIRPAGYAIRQSALCAYYRPKDLERYLRKMGVTLKDTSGLLNKTEFIRASRLPGVARRLVRQGRIRPVGYAFIRKGWLLPFYHPRQIAELKRDLGITLDDTRGLVSESHVIKLPGLSNITAYRRRGLIRPVGYAMARHTVTAFYHPRQLSELRRSLLDLRNGLKKRPRLRPQRRGSRMRV